MKTPNLDKKTLLLASLGTMLEWAEYTFYAYMAVKLSSVFFPKENESIQLIKTFGIFAAGYLMRPLGAILFGHMGDVYGRRKALMYSMLLMGLATLSIGLLPSFAQIGIASPILLLIMRLLQGLAVSGEYNGAAIYVIERSSMHPSFRGSFIPTAAAAGMVVGGFAAFLVSLAWMPDWAYRVPFLLGGLGCFIALWVRKHLHEPQEYVQAKNKQKPESWATLIKQYKVNFLRVGMVAALTAVFVYITNIYFVAYLHKYGDYPLSQATLFAMCGQLGVALLIPVSGWLADKFGPSKCYLNSLIFCALGTPCIFGLSALHQSGWMLVAMALYALINAAMSGPMMTFIQNEFPATARYRGISFAWSLFAGIFGGTSLMVAEWIQSSFSHPIAVSLYVSFFAMLSWWVLRLTGKRETQLAPAGGLPYKV